MNCVPAGPIGPVGPTGETGPTGPGWCIPYASNTQVRLRSNPGRGAAVAFGTTMSGIIYTGGFNLGGLNSNAFSIPKNCTITDIEYYFFVSAGTVILADTTVNITAQLYASVGPDENFLPIVGTDATLTPSLNSGSSPYLSGLVTTGSLNGLSIAISAKTRLILIFSLADSDAGNSLFGTVSAGVFFN